MLLQQVLLLSLVGFQVSRAAPRPRIFKGPLQASAIATPAFTSTASASVIVSVPGSSSTGSPTAPGFQIVYSRNDDAEDPPIPDEEVVANRTESDIPTGASTNASQVSSKLSRPTVVVVPPVGVSFETGLEETPDEVPAAALEGVAPVDPPVELVVDAPVSPPLSEPGVSPVSEPVSSPSSDPVSPPVSHPAGEPASEPVGLPVIPAVGLPVPDVSPIDLPGDHSKSKQDDKKKNKEKDSQRKEEQQRKDAENKKKKAAGEKQKAAGEKQKAAEEKQKSKAEQKQHQAEEKKKAAEAEKKKAAEVEQKAKAEQESEEKKKAAEEQQKQEKERKGAGTVEEAKEKEEQLKKVWEDKVDEAIGKYQEWEITKRELMKIIMESVEKTGYPKLEDYEAPLPTSEEAAAEAYKAGLKAAKAVEKAEQELAEAENARLAAEPHLEHPKQAKQELKQKQGQRAIDDQWCEAEPPPQIKSILKKQGVPFEPCQSGKYIHFDANAKAEDGLKKTPWDGVRTGKSDKKKGKGKKKGDTEKGDTKKGDKKKGEKQLGGGN